NAGTREEVCRLLEGANVPEDMPEAGVITNLLLPNASAELKRPLTAIIDFETACTALETALEWIQYVSSQAGARAITGKDFATLLDVQAITAKLPERLRRAESSIANLEGALAMQQEMAVLARSFDHATSPELLFEALLHRHHEVQQAKAPDGK